MGPHDKKHISKKYFDHRKSNIPKGPWGLGDRKIFCQNFQNKLDIRSPQGVLITKNTKVEKILSIEKLKSQGGTLGTSEVEKNFCRNFANKLYIRSLYGVLITKNTKLEKILTIEKLKPQGGTLGSKKLFVKIFQKKLYIQSPQGVLITKNTKEHKIIKNWKNRKNDPQGGTLGPQKC